jgi:5,10-methylenetetrahydromethanopterin reductase
VPAIGFKIDGRPSDDVPTLARQAEAAAFDEFWVCEDLGLAGGIAQVAASLASTQRIDVGLGIAPAAVRNPMYLAMEFASLARMFPQRFRAGIGHGEPRGLDQVGQRPGSLMSCLAEVTECVRDLLDGQAVSFHGQHVNLDDVNLTHPPESCPQISLGVLGPKGIQLCRRLGLGPILAEGSGPDYIADVRRTLGPNRHITVFVWTHLDPNSTSDAVEAMTPVVSRALTNPAMTSQLGDLLGANSTAAVVDHLGVVGDVEACESAIHRLAAAGADTIVLQPIHGREEEQIDMIGDLLLPSIRLHTARS